MVAADSVPSNDDCCQSSSHYLEFQNISDFLTALKSRKQTKRAVDWLTNEGHETVPENCSRKRCRVRAESALSILNAIRDTCRLFLEDATNNDSLVPNCESKDEFPSLASKADKRLVVQKTPQSALSKPKRRVRPVMVTTSATSSVWGMGNLVNIESTTSTTVKPGASTNWGSRCPPKPKINTSEVFSTPIKAKREGGSSASFAPTVSLEPTKKDTETVDEIANNIEVEGVVSIYCSLIENCLVPSTTLEFHLLLRILSSPLGCPPSSDQGFSRILSSRARLEYFATQSLSRLHVLIVCIGKKFLRNFTCCSILRTKVPDLMEKVDNYLNAQNHSPLRFKAEPSRTPQITLPFDEKRDSRHNYKTIDQQALYKNREECRDAFLYQLRSFLSTQGKLIDSTQSEKTLSKIRRASRTVVETVNDSNFEWFANFFTDMLLQLGLVPVQETDKDILKIDNKERLQKLHKRFSSKTSTQSKSTRKVSSARLSNQVSPAAAAQQFFPGHQEFFYIFLLSADSYCLNMHLRSVFARRLLMDWSKENEERDFTQHILENRMIARFLGVLIFSPYWRSNSEALRDKMPSTALKDLTCLGVVLPDAVHIACSSSHLVTSLSWIIECLRMSTWDTSTCLTGEYRTSMRLLRGLQLALFHDQSLSTSVRGIVRSSLESLFDETVGLTGCLLLGSSPVVLGNSELDTMDIKYHDSAERLLSASDQHLEELSQLVSRIAKSGIASTKSPGISRKLRPNVVSTPWTADKSPVKSSALSRPASAVALIQSTLRDTFFHNHPDLKLVAEFSMERLWHRALADAQERIVVSSVARQVKSDLSDQAVEDAVVGECMAHMRESLTRELNMVLSTLHDPSTTPLSVGRMACSLSVDHAIDLGRAGIASMVVSAIQRERKHASDLGTSKKLFHSSSDDVDKSNENDPHKLLHEQVARLAKEYEEADDFSMCIDSTHNLTSRLDAHAKQYAAVPQPEAELRVLMQAVLNLDGQSGRVLQWIQETNHPTDLSNKKAPFLLAFLTLACRIQTISVHGLSAMKAHISEDAALVRLWTSGFDNHWKSEFDVLLITMQETKLISKRQATLLMKSK